MTDTQNTKKLDKKYLSRRYQEALDYLDSNYAYFLTHVLKIGRPEWTNAIETAAVMLDLQDAGIFKGKLEELDYDQFKFVFKPEFAAEMDTETLAFVLSHETMHILLNHLRLVGNFVDRDRFMEINKKMKKGERLTKDEIRDSILLNQNAQRFNIAADCVINDYLANGGMKIFDGAMRGMDLVGVDCSSLTVGDVYDLLMAQAQKNKQCPTCGGTGEKPQDDQKDKGKGDKDEDKDGSGDKDDQDGSGKGDEDKDGKGEKGDAHGHGKGEPCPDCQGSGSGDGVGGKYTMMDSHDWMLDPSYADELAEAIDKFNDELEANNGMPADIQDKKDEEKGQETQRQQQLAQSMKPGTEDGNLQNFVQDLGVELAWAKLLKEIDPDMFKEPGIAPPLLPSFAHKRRKMGSTHLKKINLPVYTREYRIERLTNEKPSIVMALDTSGSIGPRDAARFVSLAQTIPAERIKLFIITFTTIYRELDLDNPQYSSGGTDFTCIGQYIEDKVKPELKGEYPKSVVVITDGEAGMSRFLPQDDKEKAAWTWLISPYDRGGYGASPVNKWGRKAMLDDYVA